MDSILWPVLGILVMVAIIGALVGASVLLWRKVFLKTNGAASQSAKAQSLPILARNGTGWQLLARLGLAGLLSLVLLVPLALIEDLASERAERKYQTLSDIRYDWGEAQTLTGPFLAVPVTFWKLVEDTVPMAVAKPDNGDVGTTIFRTVSREVSETRLAVVAPRELDISGLLAAEERKRGIYGTTVYAASVRLAGRFALPTMEALAQLAPDMELRKVDWNRARLVLGLSDREAVRRAGQLSLGREKLDLVPGNGEALGLPDGLSAPVALDPGDGEPAFSLDLDFGGSEKLLVAPVGHSSTVRLESAWPHPGFIGRTLPAEREVGPNGFTALWQVPDLAHSYPPLFLMDMNMDGEIVDGFGGHLVGVNLVVPVDSYRLSIRSTKFGCLFIFLTFLALVLSDLVASGGVGNSRRLHPLQYGLVGLALALFYLVLLSLSEHLGFGPAYLVASAINVAMIGSYALTATGRRGQGLSVVGLTSMLYGVMYVILTLEDYALLSGAALLVVAVAALMFLTRKVNLETLPAGSQAEAPVPAEGTSDSGAKG
ncbi:MAG: cell envelope integrity protein CreD [Deltaproteobacteria bacterium]|jgi:inner membrane protein|nr:cell envelope integrity protein CreD [Deltaproteobacteria bacterium]